MWSYVVLNAIKIVSRIKWKHHHDILMSLKIIEQINLKVKGNVFIPLFSASRCETVFCFIRRRKLCVLLVGWVVQYQWNLELKNIVLLNHSFTDLAEAKWSVCFTVTALEMKVSRILAQGLLHVANTGIKENFQIITNIQLALFRRQKQCNANIQWSTHKNNR